MFFGSFFDSKHVPPISSGLAEGPSGNDELFKDADSVNQIPNKDKKENVSLKLIHLMFNTHSLNVL